MCDYSMEHYKNVKAEVGKKYVLNHNYGHGFMTGMPKKGHAPVMACVAHGQRLQLTNVKSYVLPESVVVTVISRRDLQPEMRKNAHLSSFNDGVMLEDGRMFAIAGLAQHADMEVLPFVVWQKPTVKMSAKDVKPIKVRRSRRNLDKLLNLGQTRVPTVKARQLVDD